MAGIARVRYRSLFTLHVTQQSAHCPTHIEASTMALASRKKNALLQGWPARRREAGLRSVYILWGLLKLLGIRGGQAGKQKLWQAGFHQRALNLAICGMVLQRGFQHQIFLHKGPLTSERALAFKIQPCPAPLVLPWFYSVFSEKQAKYPIRKRIQPVYFASVVTDAAYSKWPLSLVVCVIHSVMSSCLQSHGLQPARLLCPWNSPGKNTGVGCHVLPFPTLGWNPRLLHSLCWQVDS